MMRPAGDIELELDCDVLERQAMESVMDRLTPLFESGAGERRALFVASPNAGSATAQRFWAGAQAAGVAFANPELFPWCLANAPCAALARRFGITGPNSTWLGGDDALQAAWCAAEHALQRRRVDCVFVVSVCFSPASGSPGRLRAWCLRAKAD
jgi:hypothetical protein